MKKMEKMIAAVIAATMMSVSFNANAADRLKKTESDAEISKSVTIEDAMTMENIVGEVKIAYGYDAQGRITSKEYVNGNVKFTYGYDSLGRVSSKIRYRKAVDETWVPKMAYQVHFGEEETVLTCARWNSRSECFNSDAIQVHFNATKYPVLFKVYR